MSIALRTPPVKNRKVDPGAWLLAAIRDVNRLRAEAERLHRAAVANPGGPLCAAGLATLVESLDAVAIDLPGVVAERVA